MICTCMVITVGCTGLKFKVIGQSQRSRRSMLMRLCNCTIKCSNNLKCCMSALVWQWITETHTKINYSFTVTNVTYNDVCITIYQGLENVKTFNSRPRPLILSLRSLDENPSLLWYRTLIGSHTLISSQTQSRFRTFCLSPYTVKNIRISTDTSCRVFHILTEPNMGPNVSTHQYKRIQNRFR